jgi:hypothetical protein
MNAEYITLSGADCDEPAPDFSGARSTRKRSHDLSRSRNNKVNACGEKYAAALALIKANARSNLRMSASGPYRKWQLQA